MSTYNIYDELVRELFASDDDTNLKNGDTYVNQPLQTQVHQQLVYYTDEEPLSHPQQSITIQKIDVIATADSTQQELQSLQAGSLTNYWQSQLSPISSVESSSTSEGVVACQINSTSSEEQAGKSLDDSVAYMKDCLDRYEKKVHANGSNGKFQVHQIVLFILLATVDSRVELNLENVLIFSDSNGKPVDGRKGKINRPEGIYFKAQDTETMGLVWQKIKGNKNGNFDTFARAMRVGRERRERKYFEYLDSGKGSKKRVYKLGRESVNEMEQMEAMLPEICCFGNKL